MNILKSILWAVSLIPAAIHGALFSIDMHTHGERGDISDAVATFDDSVKWHENRNYDGMAITNHDYLVPPDRYASLKSAHPNFVLLPAIEWSTRGSHTLAYFPPRKYNETYWSIKSNPDELAVIENSGVCIPESSRQSFINIIRKYKGIIVLAHPTLSLLEKITGVFKDDICDIPSLRYIIDDMKYDGLEVANTIPDVMAANFVRVHGNIIQTAGTDLHNTYTAIALASTIVNVGDDGAGSIDDIDDAVFEAIRAKNTTIEYNRWWVAMSNQARYIFILSVIGFVVLFTTELLIHLYVFYRMIRSAIQRCCGHGKCRRKSLQLPIVR